MSLRISLQDSIVAHNQTYMEQSARDHIIAFSLSIIGLFVLGSVLAGGPDYGAAIFIATLIDPIALVAICVAVSMTTSVRWVLVLAFGLALAFQALVGFSAASLLLRWAAYILLGALGRAALQRLIIKT